MITVWNEYRHERRSEQVAKIYPEGMHNLLAQVLKLQATMCRHTSLGRPDTRCLNKTDVLLW